MRRYSILSVGVDSISEGEFRSFARDALSSSRQCHVATVNPEFIMEAQTNERFRGILNASPCLLADGFGLHIASLILFVRNVFHRITGVRATGLLCELASQTGNAVYFVGGADGVAKRAAGVLVRRYPSLGVAGAEEGVPLGGRKTRTEYTDELVSRVNTSKASILFVAFGAPKQELWIAENLGKMPGVRITMGVGGTLDYLSGNAPYAPHWVRLIGLEWLYRLIREPKRFNRILTATIRFPLAVIAWKLSH